MDFASLHLHVTLSTLLIIRSSNYKFKELF